MKKLLGTICASIAIGLLYFGFWFFQPSDKPLQWWEIPTMMMLVIGIVGFAIAAFAFFGDK